MVASFLEPRLDLSTAPNISLMASLPVIPVPQPDEEIGEAQWNLPEVLRVNAELLLWHGGRGAVAAAETQLLRSLEHRQTACNLVMGNLLGARRRDWRGSGSVAGASLRRAICLLRPCDRFTEGFGTSDVVTARRLIAEWS